MSELHAFVTVARHGSFTRAAGELCVTQAAISRAIGRLEAHLGLTLIERSAHRLALTPAGDAYLAAVRAPVAAIEEASAALVSRRPGNRLTLSVVPTLASVWLLPRLQQFALRHPGIEVVFVPYRRDEDFSGTEPDAAILAGTGAEWSPDWDCDYVIGREVVPVAHPARLRDRREAGRWAAPADLLGEPLLYHTSTPNRWQQWLRAVGVPESGLKLASGFDHVSILIQAARTDMGIALLQRCLIQDEIAAGHLAIPFDLPVDQPKGYFLCAPAWRRTHPALAAFRGWLLEVAEGERARMPAAA